MLNTGDREPEVRPSKEKTMQGQRVKMMQGQKQDQERSRLIEESETTGSDGPLHWPRSA